MDKYGACLSSSRCFLSFITGSIKSLSVLDWQLPSSSEGRRWLLWCVGSRWEPSRMAISCTRRPWPCLEGGSTQCHGVPHWSSWQRLCWDALCSCVCSTLGWDLLLLCYPFAAALKAINTSFESRGFSKHLPSGITYHINHSPRNKLVMTWGFLSNWISPFQMLLLISLKFCKIPYVHVIAWMEESK